ncbi:DUF1850 domain-containing protein [Natribaculum luteum]|uniref:DUF1850 domain-containing protein n=1 Tax=Natribaculum luteum TaxID=1586232 RepID=A0ABD5P5S3_9EURY
MLVAGSVVGTTAYATESTDRTVVVADADSGERLLEVPVENGTEVTLSYTHSVEKTPVKDVYVVDGDRLRMVRMEFNSYGAGLPARADVEQTGDGLVTRVDKPTERLYVAPRPVPGHELVVGDDRYDLVALGDDVDSVAIFVDGGLFDGIVTEVRTAVGGDETNQ